MTPDEREFDVRTIPPPNKHRTIFRTFEALAPGESVVLLNDHEPVNLRSWMRSEHPGEFGWEYLEEGPTLWRARIWRKAEGEPGDR